MKNLIITADDFGLTKSVNEGIMKACREGIVSYISVLPSGDAFSDALTRLKENNITEIGAHLALTETAPLSRPGTVPTLTARDGRFYKDNISFFLQFFLKKIARGDIYTELKCQLNAFKTAGLKITCLSSHEHIHMMPGILEIFIGLAGEHGIPSIRYPHNEMMIKPLSVKKIYKYLVLNYFSKVLGNSLAGRRLKYADNFLGFFDSGALREGVLIKMLQNLPDGTTELVCHPGFLGPEILDRYTFHKNCEDELYALTSRKAKRLLTDTGIDLTTFGHLAPSGHVR